MRKTVLIVDDEKDQRAALREVLAAVPCRLLEAKSWEETVEMCAAHHPDLVLLDRSLGRDDVAIRLQEQPDRLGTRIVLVSAYADDAIRATFVPPQSDAGVVDLVHKPYDREDILRTVRQILDPQPPFTDARPDLITLYNRTYSLPDAKTQTDTPLIRASNAMTRAYDAIQAYAGEDAPVLITGETGTGKELAAEEAHRLSVRNEGPFKPVNCAAIPDALLESALFGHKKGAFTGALTERRGLFVEADGGTVFLDEIGELSRSTQAKLLRVLESGEIQPLGADHVDRVDVRVIAATHRDLRQLVWEEKFREDLYYRIGMLEIPLPRLAERGNDILLLIEHFIRQWSADASGIQMDEETLKRLLAYPWPGNVRELKFVMRSMIAKTRLYGPVITRLFLPLWIDDFDALRLSGDAFAENMRRACAHIDPDRLTKAGIDRYAGTLRHALFKKVYDHCEGVVADMARHLDMSRNTLYQEPWKGWIEDLKAERAGENG